MTGAVPGGADVLRAAAQSRAALGGAVTRDWHAPVSELDWTIGEVVAHVTGATLWYSVDLSARGADLTNLTITADPNASPERQLDALVAAAALLAAAVDAAPPDARGFHPMGAADASGFAAMACDEMLVHTWDVCRGVGVPFEPDAQLAAAVLGRLFPWVEDSGEPWPALLWANGRTEWHGRSRQSSWTWHCAPLVEWQP